jgi:hypothetical protein
MLYKNIQNADKLVKLMEQHKLLGSPVWKARVDHNPHGEGSPTWLWFRIDNNGNLVTCFNNQGNIDGIDYAWGEPWKTSYTGTFQLDTNPFENIKPEVYEVGDIVEVLKVAREIGGYEGWPEGKKDMIGKQFRVEKVYDEITGVSYTLQNIDVYCLFPAYAVRKVVDFAETEPDLRHKSDVLTEMNGKRNPPEIEKSIYEKFYDLANEYLDYSEQLFGRQLTYVHTSGDDYYLNLSYNTNIAVLHFTREGERFCVTFGDHFEAIKVNVDFREFSFKFTVQDKLEAQYRKFCEILEKIKEYHLKEFEAEAQRNKQELKEKFLAHLSNLEN